MLLALSIFLAVLSVVNKLLLAFDRKSGWTSGIVIGLVSALYFFIIHLRILSIAELGFFLVMLYGYLTRTTPTRKETLVVSIIISSISILLCYYWTVPSSHHGSCRNFSRIRVNIRASVLVED
jgi:hypothetical protein